MSELTNATAFWLVDVHLLAGALLAIALPAVLLLRQPAQRMAVAKAVLAALVALAILCALPGWSVAHLLSADSQPTPLATQQRPLGPALAPQPVDRLIPHISNNQVPTSASPPVSTVATAPLAIELAPRGSFWPLAVVILQAAGSALIVLWLIAGAYAAHRLRRGADPAPTELTHLLAKFTGNARPTALLLSASIAMPVALGLRRPAIILPRPSGEGQGKGEPSPRLTSHTALPAILAHEYAHIAAGDLRTLAVTRLLLVLFWPQPLFWLLRRRIRFDQESLADVAAADVAGRLCYAEPLVGWARMAPTRGPGSPAPSACGRGHRN